MRPIFRVHAVFAAALALSRLPFGSLAQAEMRVFVVDEAAGTVRQYSGTGDDLGVFAAGLASPGWITADRAGNIYVVENSGPGGCCQGWVGTINKFSPTGDLLLTIATPFTAAGVRVGSDGTIYTAAYGGGPDQPDRGIYRYSASGVALGLFALPSGLGGDFIAFDQSGNLYAPNNSTGAIVRISPTGADLGVFATLPGAEGIAFDPIGNVYVSSYSGTVIEKYSASGADEGTFASIELSNIYGLAFDSHGNLYVANCPFGPWPPSLNP
jgi:sugar lactone lactonase YvrE